MQKEPQNQDYCQGLVLISQWFQVSDNLDFLKWPYFYGLPFENMYFVDHFLEKTTPK